jgi:hypothetical protein
MGNVRLGLVVAFLLALTVLVHLADSRVLAQRRSVGPQLRAAHRDLEIQLDDEVKIRSLKAPVLMDEDGKPRKPTSEELKELKGSDPKAPGYARDLRDLKKGQMVRVYLARQKRAKREEKTPDDNPNKAPAEKSSWVSAGQLVGMVVGVGAQKPAGRDKKEAPQEARKTITLRADYATANRSGRGAPADDGGTGRVGTEIRATMIVILQDVKPTSQKPRDKAPEDK